MSLQKLQLVFIYVDCQLKTTQRLLHLIVICIEIKADATQYKTIQIYVLFFKCHISMHFIYVFDLSIVALCQKREKDDGCNIFGMADIDGHQSLQKYTAPSLYKVRSLPLSCVGHCLVWPDSTHSSKVVSGSVVPVIDLL